MKKIEDFLVSTVLFLLASLFVMLGVGVVHAHLLPAVQAAGIVPCAWVTFLFGTAAWIYTIYIETL